jgi:hypothetical protein
MMSLARLTCRAIVAGSLFDPLRINPFFRCCHQDQVIEQTGILIDDRQGVFDLVGDGCRNFGKGGDACRFCRFRIVHGQWSR